MCENYVEMFCLEDFTKLLIPESIIDVKTVQDTHLLKRYNCNILYLELAIEVCSLLILSESLEWKYLGK